MAIFYTKKDCVDCYQTDQMLKSLGAIYDEVDLTGNPELEAEVRKQGNLKLPVLVMDDGKRFGGFSPREIEKILRRQGPIDDRSLPTVSGKSTDSKGA